MSDTITQTLVDPTLFPPVIEYDFEDAWIETPTDVDNQGIVDTAGQLPLKPIHVLQAIAVYRITLLLTTYTDADWRNQHNTLNLSPWRGWASGEAWCAASRRIRNINDVNCLEVSYKVRCLRGGWKTKVPDAGYVYLDGSNLKDWTTADDSLTIGKLTSAGGKAGAAAPLTVTEWDTKRSINFSFLPTSP